MKKLLKSAKCVVARYNFYYKISDLFDGTVLGMPGKHFVLEGNHEKVEAPGIHYELHRMSNKVWQEWDDGEVRILKSRSISIYHGADVDMKEFMWVKLKAKSLI